MSKAKPAVKKSIVDPTLAEAQAELNHRLKLQRSERSDLDVNGCKKSLEELDAE